MEVVVVRHVGVHSGQGSGLFVVGPVGLSWGDGKTPLTHEVDRDHRHARLTAQVAW